MWVYVLIIIIIITMDDGYELGKSSVGFVTGSKYILGNGGLVLSEEAGDEAEFAELGKDGYWA